MSSFRSFSWRSLAVLCLVACCAACDDGAAAISIPTEGDAAVDSDGSAVVDTGGVIAFDADARHEDATACAPNACGGCAALAGTPDASCGDAGFFWRCSDKDHVVCAFDAAPFNVRASTDRDDGVNVTWMPPVDGTPDSYDVVRDAVVVASVPASTGAWLDVTAPVGTVSAIADLTASDGTRSDGVALAWTAPTTTPGRSFVYSVTAHYGPRQVAATETSTGSRQTRFIYELSRDDGATWIPTNDSESAYLDVSAPLAVLSGGAAKASEDLWRSLARLELTQDPATTLTRSRYRVRAVVSGSPEPESNAADGARAPGALRVQWHRSAAASDASYAPLSGVTGRLWVDVDAPLDDTRFYNAVVDGPGAAPVTIGAGSVTVRSLRLLSWPMPDFWATYGGCGLLANRHPACMHVAPPDIELDAVAAADAYACGIRHSDQHIVCAGSPWEVPATTVDGPVLALSIGKTGVGCAIKPDHHLACWGMSVDAAFAQQEFAAIRVGPKTTCGLLTNGAAVCTALLSPAYGASSAPPSGSFSDICVGDSHACVLDASGKITCWGRMPNGGDLAPAGTFTKIACGYAETCGLRSDGTLACASRQHLEMTDSYAELVMQQGACLRRVDGRLRCFGEGPSVPRPERVKAVAFGGPTCVLLDDGRRTCFGESFWNEVSTGPSNETFVSIVGSSSSVCGLDSAQHVSCAGYKPWSTVPTAIASRTVLELAASGRGSCGLLDDGTISCWPAGISGSVTAPPGNFARIAVADSGVYALRTDGQTVLGPDGVDRVAPSRITVIRAGATVLTALATDGTFMSMQPTDAGWSIATPSAARFRAISTLPSADGACGLREDGHVECFDATGASAVKWPRDQFVYVAGNDVQGCAIRDDGHLLCWPGVGLSATPTP